MKYLIATVIILGSIINSSKSSYCLETTREMEAIAHEQLKIHEKNPGNRLLISQMKHDLKTYEENLKENNCDEITTKYLSPNAKNEFSEKSSYLKDQYDFYAVASGEPYILVKLRRIFGLNK